MDYVPFVDYNDSSGTDMGDEILQELEEDILIVYKMMMVSCNAYHSFNANELEEGGQVIVNHNEGLQSSSSMCTRSLHCLRF